MGYSRLSIPTGTTGFLCDKMVAGQRMPFKTKRQKISAFKRHFTYIEQLTVGYSGTAEKTVKTQEAASSFVKTSQKKGQIEGSYEYIASDLIKILILAFGIIVSQVLLGAVLS